MKRNPLTAKNAKFARKGRKENTTTYIFACLYIILCVPLFWVITKVHKGKYKNFIMKIGLLSDTHGWIHPRIFDHFAECDEIWHAGDIGNIETADELAGFKPMRAVYGNIDNSVIRSIYKENLIFNAEETKVWMTHIGGTPGHYDRRLFPELIENPPDIFICGHSHIAKVKFDDKGGFLYVNPGAAGYNGFHKFMTIIRFQIDGKRIHDMELIEMGERGKVIL